MLHIKKFLLSILLCLSIVIISLPTPAKTASAADSLSFIILSQYNATVDIGKEFYIVALTSNGKLPSWKSSNTKVASVNTYGKVIAKKSGTATITAKIKNAEASCKIKVNKTVITISQTSASLERGETLTLSASTSNHSKVVWKSSRKSVATIDENGTLTGIKPGETTITATADGSSVTCKVKVKYPTIKLDKTKIKLFRGQTVKVNATVSSSVTPVWKSNKKSVALVDQDGNITAVKNGTATITATVDGISKTCEVIVEKPTITLSAPELHLKVGDTSTVTAYVSSGNSVVWSSSNSNVATVNSSGTISALQKGRAYIYATEDGTKVRCVVYVTE
ncbi:Ig domain-containing protein [Lachnospiraceae bacterium MD1]|uniref:Ig domain-containing protein n=1 Tax=Variimorphobacter saccharofermentans TaxID=2755051 RepID=A0A839K4A6_9FIRM|nr:Ig-like domain-containing protein [Variimorphobacter saccharofermentans]MBB2184440.1 Ig domain-containing protein [Variimorphobacter saccharofermentans]